MNTEAGECRAQTGPGIAGHTAGHRPGGADPQGMGHLVAIIFTIGAELLDGVATILNALVGSHAAH
jgi:hypothetical protein